MRLILVLAAAGLAAPSVAAPAAPKIENITCRDGFKFRISAQRDKYFSLVSPVTLLLPGQKPQTLVRDPGMGVGEDYFSNDEWTLSEYRMTRSLDNKKSRKLSHDCPPGTR